MPLIHFFRRPGEKLVIALPSEMPVWIQIMSITDNVVKLGFEAEREVSVWREEIWRKIELEPPPYV